MGLESRGPGGVMVWFCTQAKGLVRVCTWLGQMVSERRPSRQSYPCDTCIRSLVLSCGKTMTIGCLDERVCDGCREVHQCGDVVRIRGGGVPAGTPSIACVCSGGCDAVEGRRLRGGNRGGIYELNIGSTQGNANRWFVVHWKHQHTDM